MQNHADREQFTKSVKVDVNKIFTPKAGRTAEQMDYDTTMAARNDKGGVIVTTKGNLIVNRDKNPQLFPFGKKVDSINKIGKSAPMKYIKVYNKTGGGYRLFEYKETAFDQKNNDLYEGRNKIDTVTYFPINTLGTSNFVLEFNFYDDINETAVPKKKKVVTKGPIAYMEAEMDKLSDDAMMSGIEQDALQDLSSLKPTVAPTTQPSTSVAGININTKSSDKLGRELTNPNWGAKNIMDIEAEYKANASKIKAPELTMDEALKYDMNLMYKLQMKKFKAHPELIQEITDRGGVKFLEASEHTVGVKGSRWEGKGTNSNFIKVLIKSYQDSLDTTQPSTSVKPLSLAQMADTGLSEKQEGTAPAAPKTLTLAQMADVNAKEPMGLFEKLEANDFEEYTKAGGTELSKKDFLSLSAQEQANAIYQAKNCK